MATDPIAVDLSHHNRITDADALFRSGIIAVLLKATEGTTFVDETFAARRQKAKDAGIIVVPYHFLKHGNAIDQIRFFLRTVNPDYGERIAIDYEHADLVLRDLDDAVAALRAYGKALQITIYGAARLTDDVNAANPPANFLKDTSLWAARYNTKEPVIANIWPTWSLWQYTDKGRIAGIDGDVDLNRFNGSDEQARKWFTPPVNPEIPTVEITTTGRVQVVVNGKLVVDG